MALRRWAECQYGDRGAARMYETERGMGDGVLIFAFVGWRVVRKGESS